MGIYHVNQQEILYVLEECEKVIRECYLPNFKISDVDIRFTLGSGGGVAYYRKLNFAPKLTYTPKEYDHLERKPDLSTDGLMYEWWIAAHEISHLVCYELERLRVEFQETSDFEELEEWQRTHKEMITAFRWYLHGRKGGEQLTKWSPVNALCKQISGSDNAHDNPSKLYELLMYHTIWAYSIRDRWDIAKQVSHGSCFEHIYRTLRELVVNPEFDKNTPIQNTRLVKYNKNFFRTYQNVYKPRRRY